VSVKIQALLSTTPESFEYGNTFIRENVAGRGRLQIGLDDAPDGCMQQFASLLVGPFQLLYVLHTSRTGAELGRYESPELNVAAVEDFFRKFGRFLSEDSRHDLWLRSYDDDATIVLDRHNIIYAYGPIDVFEAALVRLGARSGRAPQIPDPHVHNYHHEWDESEREVLRSLAWTIKPLRQSDVQFNDAG
jgi:hypothetical protein